MDVDSGKKYLQQQPTDKPSVFEHFAAIIDKVILQKPDDPHGALEVLSRLIKAPAPTGESFEEAELEAMKTKAASMIAVTETPMEGEDAKKLCAIPDFMEEASMLEWAGVGFGELESYQIMCSLRKLAAENMEGDGIKKLRFWGKILGTSADYYVAEGQLEAAGDADENDPDEPEPQGSGPNAFTFWVTTSLTGTWEKLPHIKPKHIIAARKIKKILTGDISSKVITHPHFPGTEKELLRAQIARITADTVLCISGFVTTNEDGEVTDNPEFVSPTADELAKPEGWTHERAHILKTGKTIHKEIPEEGGEGLEPDEQKKIDALKKMVENDPVRSRIRGIATDPDLQWSVKQGGDKSLYAAGEKPKSFAVTSVRCLTWPGAVTVCKGGHFTNLYIGHGLKYGEPDFFPCAPLDIQEEPEDPGEMPEPQPEGAPPTQEEPKGEAEEGG
jgi:radial spoke head protein 4A